MRRMFTADTGGSLTTLYHLYHYRVNFSAGCQCKLRPQLLSVYCSC